MSYLLPGKRSKELAAVAAANRLTYTLEDTSGCTELPFTLFVQGTGHAAQNVLSGRLHQTTVRGFDFPYVSNPPAVTRAGHGLSGRPPVIPYEDGKQYGCALVVTAQRFPFLHLAPRSRRRALPLELEFETPHGALSKAYQCWTLDHEAASHLLDTEVADFLAGTKGQFEFELCGTGVLAMVNGIKAEDFPAFMAMSVRFAEVLGRAAARSPLAHTPPAEPAPAPGPSSPVEPVAAVAAPVVAVGAGISVATLPPPPRDTSRLPLPPPPSDADRAPLPPPPPL